MSILAFHCYKIFSFPLLLFLCRLDNLSLSQVDLMRSFCRCAMSEVNPCMTCGACCAYFRVSFYWAEASDGGGTVPVHLTEPLTPFCAAWRHQSKAGPLRVQGEPGVSTRCAIYEDRPSPCREFAMSGKMGRSTKPVIAPARAGLPPLYKDMLFHTSLDAATAGSSGVQLPAN